MAVGSLVLAAAGGAAAFALLGGGPTTDEYIADADQVCAETNPELSRVGRIDTYPDLASSVTSIASGIDAQLGQLSGVTKPSGSGGEQAAAVLAAFGSTSEATDDLAAAANAADDAATVEATHRFAGAFNEARDAAVDFGMESCVVGMQGGVDNLFASAGAVVKVGYLAEAEALCQAAARAAFDLPIPYDFSALVSGLRAGQSIDRDLIAGLDALTVPPGDEPVVAEMLDSFRVAIARVGAWIDAIAAQDFARGDALLLEVSRLSTATNALLDDYGLDACGSNFGLL